VDQAPRILLVEDEHLIAMAAQVALEEAGFEVTAISTSSAAISALESGIADFAALVTDIRLGKGEDGWQIARRARYLSATMPVVYASGDSAADWPSEGVPNSIMLSKPYAEAQLIQAVTQLINERPIEG
jgi:DNA-binding response OmpR family regulator